jgi:hypothetical protein
MAESGKVVLTLAIYSSQAADVYYYTLLKCSANIFCDVHLEYKNT